MHERCQFGVIREGRSLECHRPSVVRTHRLDELTDGARLALDAGRMQHAARKWLNSVSPELLAPVRPSPTLGLRRSARSVLPWITAAVIITAIALLVALGH